MFYYISTPYAHPDPDVRQYRFEVAAEIEMDFVRHGRLAFSPIAQSHPKALRGIEPPDGWYDWDLRLLESFRPDQLTVVVVKMKGWAASRGVQMEVAWALEHDVPVEFLVYPSVGFRIPAH